MPSFGNWLGDKRIKPTSTANRAALCWRRIQDRPTSIVIFRANPANPAGADTQLGAQDVRIEYNDEIHKATGNAGEMEVRKLLVVGVKDHATVTDTDIKENDKFAVDGHYYKVVDIVLVPGEVQCRCERVS